MCPTRAPSHIIDEQARRILTRSLPPEWVCEPRHTDYGIDYILEVFEPDQYGHHRPTGEQVEIQLKGVVRPKQSNTYLRHSVDTDHLRHYLQRYLPVFLVVANVSTGEAYWYFLQGACELSDTKKLQMQETITLRISRSNRLNSAADFLASIRKAISYQQINRPGSLAAAVQAEQDRLAKHDPRIKATIATSTTLHSISGQPLSFTLTLTGPANKVQAAQQDLLMFGKPVAPSTHGITIQARGLPGRPELSTITSVHATKKGSGSATFCLLTESGDPTRGMELSVPIEGGTHEMRYDCRLPSGLFQATIVLNSDTLASKSGAMTLEFDITRWSQVDVRRLVDFDRVHRLASTRDGVFGTAPLRFELFLNGNYVTTGVTKDDHNEVINHFVHYVEIVWKLRFISTRLNVPIILPLEMTRRDAEVVEILYQYLTNGKAPCSAVGASAVSDGNYEQLVQVTREERGTIIAPIDKHDLVISGQHVSIGPLWLMACGVRFSVESISPTAGASHGNLRLTVMECDKAFLVRRLNDAAPPDPAEVFG